jgi:protein-tyrosine kinase
MKLFEVQEPAPQESAVRERTIASLEDRTIGRILVDMGKLREKDVGRVFALHRRKGLRFGEAARRLRLVDEADVQYALSIQFNYPYLKPGQGMLGVELIAAHEPFDSRAEALRDVRTHLLMQWADENRKVLAIVSPGAKDGRSYLAANLAVTFAQLGQETLLIDADLRRPRQHRIFGLNGATGLAQALSGRGGITAAERIPYFESLGVLAAGTTPPNPLELLCRADLTRLLAEARKRYAIVLVDTAASEQGADAKVIAARADGVLMLARQDHTRVADLDRLKRAAAASGVPIVGTVLNRL